MSWTDERVETLKTMWSEGKSASQIAKELGGVTRNAVIGKVHRLGLSNRVGGAERSEEEPGHDEIAEEASPSPRRPRRPSRPRSRRPRPPPRPPRAEDAPALVRAKPSRGQPLPPQPAASRSAPRRWPTSPRSPRRPSG